MVRIGASRDSGRGVAMYAMAALAALLTALFLAAPASAQETVRLVNGETGETVEPGALVYGESRDTWLRGQQFEAGCARINFVSEVMASGEGPVKLLPVEEATHENCHMTSWGGYGVLFDPFTLGELELLATGATSGGAFDADIIVPGIPSYCDNVHHSDPFNAWESDGASSTVTWDFTATMTGSCIFGKNPEFTGSFELTDESGIPVGIEVE